MLSCPKEVDESQHKHIHIETCLCKEGRIHAEGSSKNICHFLYKNFLNILTTHKHSLILSKIFKKFIKWHHCTKLFNPLWYITTIVYKQIFLIV